MSLVIVLGIVLGAQTGGAGTMRTPRYFPETGRGAVHQHALDLSGSTVVLAFALQPGYEDIPLLAYLRTAKGTRVAVAYVTNGESTPTDEGGRNPASTAGERKEEAFAVMRALDANARFLNLPDPGVISSRGELEEIWGADTALARIGRVLHYFRPDVVLLEGDQRGDTARSMRQRLLVDLVLKAIGTPSKPGGKPDDAMSGNLSPSPRVFVESERGERNTREAEYDRPHPVWKISYRLIASEAANEYRGLRLQLPFWMGRGDRRYTSVKSGTTERLQSMVAGLPLIAPPLHSLAVAIRSVASRTVRGVYTPLLPEVVRAIDSLDLHLAWERRSVAGHDLRLLAAWKDGLESLRCSLLDLGLVYAPSESLVTEKQLFYLKFDGLPPRASGRGSRIYFPAAIDHSWGVNESVEYQFPFQPPQQFEVLTPRSMEYDSPAGQFGIRQSTLRTRFSFLIVHHDSAGRGSYLYRGEVLLRTGPKRMFEILTPVVRGIDGQPIICRLTNVSRDPFKGEISIDDTLLNSIQKSVSLKGKDAVVIDTVLLSLRSPLPQGDYPLSVMLPGGVNQSVILRSFEASIDSQARVALLTDINDSPIAHALDRLGVSWRRIDPSLESSSLSGTNVMILDRDALAGLRRAKGQAQTITSWVRGGGHLLVLPQHDVADGGSGFIPGFSFRRSPLLPPGAPLKIDTANLLLRSPNILSECDWDGWVVARSLCSVQVSPDLAASVLVSSADGNVPLLVTVAEGKGRITLVALDCISQLINVHPGVHRIFANLLKPNR
jgi:hypothetical protein